MVIALIVVIVLVFLFGLVAGSGFRVVQQYEQGVVFRLGRVQPELRPPGLTRVVPGVDRLAKVNMQIVTMGIPAQEGITRDNVTLRVDAVVYFRVIDPVKAIVNVQDYRQAVSQISQTSLRSIIGQSLLDEMLSERDRINEALRGLIDAPTEGPWGVRIERVEVKDVSLPESMKRSMSRQAEAERERRARIITADGEFQAANKLAEAARTLDASAGALQLRLLQTVVEVAAEKNSTLVMPVPVELLRFFDRAAASSAAASSAAVSPTTASPATASPTTVSPTTASPATTTQGGTGRAPAPSPLAVGEPVVPEPVVPEPVVPEPEVPEPVVPEPVVFSAPPATAMPVGDNQGSAETSR